MEKVEKQSDKEMELHKKFRFWDSGTTFTRYLMVAFMGAVFYDFSTSDFLILYIFLGTIVLNGYFYYSMKHTFDKIVIERMEHNYGDK